MLGFKLAAGASSAAAQAGTRAAGIGPGNEAVAV
jgi:hypothetical protein